MSKKLLIASDCFLPRWDGIARFLNEVIPSISDEYLITVIAPDFKGVHPEYPNVRVIRMPLNKRLIIGDFTPTKVKSSVVKKEVEQSDIVWIHTTGPIGSAAAKFAKKKNIPYSVYVHSIDWQLVMWAVAKEKLFALPFGLLAKYHTKKIYNGARRIMVPSAEVRELLRWNNITSQIDIVRLGIDSNEFIPLDDKNEAKDLLGIPQDTAVIGFVGRLSREKDVLTLYRAFLRLQKEFPKTKLLVVGDGLVSYKEKMHQNSDVIMVGASNNVLSYLHAMDMYVLSSQLETTSLSTLEAMSCEIPVVATPVGLVKEYIIDRDNGLTFPKGNSLVCYLKLKWLLENEKEREAIGVRGRNTVLQSFEISQTIDRVKELLKQL